MRVAAVQLRVGTVKDDNLDRALRLIDEAAAAGASLVVLPECFTYIGPPESFAAAAESIPGPTTAVLAAKAREHGIVLHAGSIVEDRQELAPGAPHLSNTSCLFDRGGELVATYRKTHLFDVAVGSEVAVRESATIVAGDELVSVPGHGFTLGLSICYDVRFPELYRALAAVGADLFVVPAAFAAATGRAHWEVLLRARAIENGAYVVAAAQHGHAAAWPMHGHSLVVDPWGAVLGELPEGDGIVLAELDPAVVAQRRAQIPALRHRRPELYERPVNSARSLAFW